MTDKQSTRNVAGEPLHPGPVSATATATATELGLQLECLRKTYKKTFGKPFDSQNEAALKSLTCRFPTGHCTGLIGHNGAGKTTVIKLILGITKPNSGRITWQGQTMSNRHRQSIGYMPESRKLPAYLTCTELLDHQLQITTVTDRSGRKGKVAGKLAEVGLSKVANQVIKTLSKGMTRRLAWANATIHQPKLLILDEPSSGLDPLGRQLMFEWIETERRRGTTIVLCTHELRHITELCQGYHVLNQGELIHSSEPTSATTMHNTYHLHISGTDDDFLLELKRSSALPIWQDLRVRGFVRTLYFDDYEVATAWLTACISSGIVVTSFGAVDSLGEAEILGYFGVENNEESPKG